MSPRDPDKATRAYLVVIYGAELGRRLSVGTSTFEIGRSSKNDLAIDHDAVSRNHARITYEKELGVHVIRDMGSTNGTFVNDQRIEKASLLEGDQVRVGRTLLKYMGVQEFEARYHEEIYRLMTVDALTRAYVERYFLEALERECNRARRYARELSLFIFDVDALGALNAAHGQVASDALLRQLIAAIQPRLRREDVLARLTGGTFAVLLPEVGAPGARIAADKVRAVVANTPFDAGGTVVKVTVSAGVTSLEPEHHEGAALIRAARAALARAKARGKNRVA